jgi:hypothetical protein
MNGAPGTRRMPSQAMRLHEHVLREDDLFGELRGREGGGVGVLHGVSARVTYSGARRRGVESGWGAGV